jgi:hypothetical protein
MFLLQCLAVVAAAFWISAVAAEAVLRSAAERALAPGVRVGFGFMLTLAWFTAAWQVMSITQAWLVGLVLFALFAWARFGAPSAARARSGVATLWARYRHAFAGFFAGTILFFGPLAAVFTFGPFTEGGGDVSIYADTTKFLVDRGLTEFGLPSRDGEDVQRNLRELAMQGGGERPGADKSPLMNPPSPEYPAYRILITRTMSPFLYTQFGMYSFLAGATNYHVYYGLQAFIYSALLVAIWSFFRRYGARAAIAGVAFAALSHSLVSIFYNTYAAQSIALLASGLVVAAVMHVRIPSWAAVRTYGCVLLLIWVTYVHYLSVLLPMLLVAFVAPRAAPVAQGGEARPARRWPAWVAIATFAVACGSLAYAGMLKSVQIAQVLINASLQRSTPKDMLIYMGNPIDAFSVQWIAFLTGMVSQQHFDPYVLDYPAVPLMMRVAVVGACALFLLGLALMARWALERRGSWRPVLQDAAVYGIALATIAVHLVLVRTSLYTQAKGAQNILVLVFIVLLMPLALAYRDLPRTLPVRMLLRAAAVALLLFVAMSLVMRSMFGYRLGLGLDRSAILEPSFFAEAARIRKADPQALVLFEPRKSADLYTHNQAFFGLRAVPTRELILQKSRRTPGGSWDITRAQAVEFVEESDLPHTWLLRSTSARRWPFLQRWAHKIPQMPMMYEWHAERLADSTGPRIVMSGDTYERPYGELNLGGEPQGARALFNFARNGIVSLYLPANMPARVSVELKPREGGYDALVAETRKRVEAGEFGADTRMTATGKVVRLESSIPAAAKPTLRHVAAYKGEFFVNVKVDGKDVP